MANFSEPLNAVSREKKELIILGDMNVDLLKNDSKSKTFQDFMENDYDFTQLITVPTRMSSVTESLINHIFVTHPENITQSFVEKYYISDQFPVCVTRKASMKDK